MSAALFGSLWLACGLAAGWLLYHDCTDAERRHNTGRSIVCLVFGPLLLGAVLLVTVVSLVKRLIKRPH